MFNEFKHWLYHDRVDTGAADARPAALRHGYDGDLRVHQVDFAAERARIAELSTLLARAVADMRSEHFETGTEGYIISVTRDWIDETTAESALSEG
ncbi:MAG TPA: hypothetical protein VGN52_23330 [Burkholderiales bacterium]|jgi:hypothetical protein